MSSASFTEPLAAWLGERMPLRLFGPAAAVILAGAALAGTPSLAWLAGALPVLALLLLQFRLWDDLADATRDRAAHPQRVLPRCGSLRPFQVALVAALLAAVLAVAPLSGLVGVLALVTLDACAALWYLRPFADRTGPLSSLALLAKYPVFAVVIAPSPTDPSSLAFACGAIYLVFCIHEWRTA